MRLYFAALALAVAFISIIGSAQAGTITTTATVTAKSFSGSVGSVPVDPVQMKFTITLDPNATYTNEASGLVVDFMNIAYTGPLLFNYDGHGGITIGGNYDGISSVTWGESDFFLAFQLISNPSWSTLPYFLYSQAGIHDVFLAESVTVATTPIPAALPLFATAVAGLGGFVGFKRRRAGRIVN